MQTSNKSWLNQSLVNYLARVKAFSSNARLYLVYVAIAGMAFGGFMLLFNFYILSQGYDESLLGNLITTSNLSALITALPCGYLADVLGRKRALLISSGLISMSILVMVLLPGEEMFYAMNILSGLGQSLAAVTMAPFLMENSQEEERTYLFSLSSGLQMAMASVGNWIGGYLPIWVAKAQVVSATSVQAYSGAVLAIGVVTASSLLPLTVLRATPAAQKAQSLMAPFAYARQHPGLLGKLILPVLITSLGAGLIMPFMNVFYRVVHHQPDPVIGTLFAWGSLAMGIGFLVAPLLADRLGKIQCVVVTQAISIPFLVLLGFSPLFWVSAMAYYIRLALMNMSTPVYQTYVMEHVETSARATVASLAAMAWNFGWAISPTISGKLQVRYGFGPPFLGTIVFYSVAIGLYWLFFLRRPVPLAEKSSIEG